MPTSSWTTPTLLKVRQQNRDFVTAKLGYAIAPNSPEAVLSDASAGNAHLNLQYLDWQANQLLPDSCEKQFLDRWANIYLINADGSRGRKVPTYASGMAKITATAVTILPAGSQLLAGNLLFATTSQVTLGVGQNPVPIRALDAGSVGNLPDGTPMSLAVAVVNISATAGIVASGMAGGTDEENDDELRVRVLQRIRKPPMGGDADDYEAWALEVAGVTRAWCAPREMGLGTVTVRFMCDDLRASNGGLPTPNDVAAVQAYFELVRPVTADVFVVSPIPQPVNFSIQNLVGDSPSLRASAASAVSAMLMRKAAPASQVNGVRVPAVNIPAAWVNNAVYNGVGGVPFDLVMPDAVMPSASSLAVLGTIS